MGKVFMIVIGEYVRESTSGKTQCEISHTERIAGKVSAFTAARSKDEDDNTDRKPKERISLSNLIRMLSLNAVSSRKLDEMMSGRSLQPSS